MKLINSKIFLEVFYQKLEIIMSKETQHNFKFTDDTIIFFFLIQDINSTDSFFDSPIGPRNIPLKTMTKLNYIRISSINNNIKIMLGVPDIVPVEVHKLLLLTLAWEFDFLPKYSRQTHRENLTRFLLFYKIQDPNYFIRNGMPIKYHEKQPGLDNSVSGNPTTDILPEPKASRQ